MRAFTLSELLVSLSILGLIAALTLPSIFNSVNKSKEKAAYRETINVLQNVLYDGLMSGELDALSVNNSSQVLFDQTEFHNWLKSKVNFAVDCSTSSDSRCTQNITASGLGSYNGVTEKYLLHNGVLLTVLKRYANNMAFLLNYEGGDFTSVIDDQGQGDGLTLGIRVREPIVSWWLDCDGNIPPTGKLIAQGCQSQESIIWLSQ